MTGYPSKYFETGAHAMDAGIVAGLLKDAVNAEGVVIDGDHTPWIDIPLPDFIPYPSRVIRVRVEVPDRDYTLADMAEAVMQAGDPESMKAFAAAVDEAELGGGGQMP